MKPTRALKTWLAVLMLTFFALALLIAVGALSAAYLWPIIGQGVYVVVIAVAAALSLALGGIVRWLVSS